MIDPVSSSFAALQNLRSPDRANPVSTPQIRIGELPAAGGTEGVRGPGGASFSDLVGGLVRSVDSKSKVADAEVRSLMLGESDNIHRSMIAMQESGLAFNLLIEVRNKLVESYQELMRMPV
ncbi:flagellar hook-basal body complex protein FliE [Opitutales bacterium ASA1]|uniref:flagellar hook-basal body complex protein FliE n=1 Tax=Congregicoccus parvus TaxID=3081749 RepID=UPI002B2D4D74|nr:flagellar hook-basal body complex protein FliE [Opitutales bacterium ASA1]